MTKKQEPISLAKPFLASVIIVSLVLIAVSSLTNAALALKNNSQGKSGVVRQQCLNGIQNAAIDVGVCSIADLQKFNQILLIRETQGIKAAKDACSSQITNQGCRGLCVAAVNCYDIR